MSGTESSPIARHKGRPRSFDRDHALTQALDVFWHRGYELASVAELCAAMGINPPSLYAAFGNKAKLFVEAVVVTAAASVSEDSVEVRAAINALRLEGKNSFAKRLERAKSEGQLPVETEVSSLADALNTMLEGMSIQARDGLTLAQMRRLAAHATRLLPPPPATTSS